MNEILLEGMRVYAYHGCLEEEAIIGAEYIVDVTLECDFTKAAKTDNISYTIDYVIVYNIIKIQMAIKSKLIEHVAQRIVEALKKEFGILKKIKVKVTKLNPPINGNVEKVSVVITDWVFKN